MQVIGFRRSNDRNRGARTNGRWNSGKHRAEGEPLAENGGVRVGGGGAIERIWRWGGNMQARESEFGVFVGQGVAA
jgi:hypothetical protein